MKRKWASIVAVLLAVMVLVSTAVPVLAQSEEETADSEAVLRAALAIMAPRRAPVGEAVTMTVFQRGTLDPVKDAGIWALTRDEAEALKAEIAGIREEGGNGVRDLDHESLLRDHGTFLGTTHGNGQLKHAFDEAGWYLLVAVKEGYHPGRTPIAIRAPRTVEPAGLAES
jgi:hypothetical protein